MRLIIVENTFTCWRTVQNCIVYIYPNYSTYEARTCMHLTFERIMAALT